MNIKQTPANPNNYLAVETKKVGIVYHWIVGTAESCIDTFQNPKRRASAHYIISDTGEIFQAVPDKWVAWHAGNADANRKYIGIEHEGGYLQSGKRVKPTEACHKASVELSKYLADKHGFSLSRLSNAKRHNEVSDKATSCCGSLDVDWIVNEVNRLSITTNPVGSKYTADELKKALEWNDNIQKGEYYKDHSKLMNDLSSEEYKQFLVDLWRLSWQTIDKTTLENNAYIENTILKYVEYLKKSSKV